jgi:hypothetical protein
MKIFQNKFFWIGVVAWVLFAVYVESKTDYAMHDQIQREAVERYKTASEEMRVKQESEKLNQYNNPPQLQYNTNPAQTFGSYPCTQDCSGHQAGYDWAEKKDIDSIDNCGGNSQSFIEGCYDYVKENYPGPDNCENYNYEYEICED